jgi:hypothetical protein
VIIFLGRFKALYRKLIIPLSRHSNCLPRRLDLFTLFFFFPLLLTFFFFLNSSLPSLVPLLLLLPLSYSILNIISRNQVCFRKRLVGFRARFPLLNPLNDVLLIVQVSVFGHHRVYHDLPGNRAEERVDLLFLVGFWWGLLLVR